MLQPQAKDVSEIATQPIPTFGNIANRINLGVGSHLTMISRIDTQQQELAVLASALAANSQKERATIPFSTIPISLAAQRGIFIYKPQDSNATHYLGATLYINERHTIVVQSHMSEPPTPTQQERFRHITGTGTVSIAQRFIDQYLPHLDRKALLIETLIAALHERDVETARHCLLVGKLARHIGMEMGLDELILDLLETSGKLHDIGKLGIPNDIINKTGPLTKEEWAIMKEHPTIGKKMIEHLPEFKFIQLGIFQHHERFNKSGYPQGLGGTDISLIGRIIGIADVIAALSAERPYKIRMEIEDLQDYILKQSGKAFDPILVAIMTRLLEEQKIYDLLYKESSISFPIWLAK